MATTTYANRLEDFRTIHCKDGYEIRQLGGGEEYGVFLNDELLARSFDLYEALCDVNQLKAR